LHLSGQSTVLEKPEPFSRNFWVSFSQCFWDRYSSFITGTVPLTASKGNQGSASLKGEAEWLKGEAEWLKGEA
jgi:hypothetical protein